MQRLTYHTYLAAAQSTMTVAVKMWCLSIVHVASHPRETSFTFPSRIRKIKGADYRSDTKGHLPLDRYLKPSISKATRVMFTRRNGWSMLVEISTLPGVAWRREAPVVDCSSISTSVKGGWLPMFASRSKSNHAHKNTIETVRVRRNSEKAPGHNRRQNQPFTGRHPAVDHVRCHEYQ